MQPNLLDYLPDEELEALRRFRHVKIFNIRGDIHFEDALEDELRAWLGISKKEAQLL